MPGYFFKNVKTPPWNSKQGFRSYPSDPPKFFHHPNRWRKFTQLSERPGKDANAPFSPASLPALHGRVCCMLHVCMCPVLFFVHQLANVGVWVQSACRCTQLYVYVFLQQRGRSINEATVKQRHTAPFWTFQRSSSQVSEPCRVVPFLGLVAVAEFWLKSEQWECFDNHGCGSRTSKSPHTLIKAS